MILKKTKQLPSIINRRGAEYILIQRGKKSLIYARTVHESVQSFEVFLIKIRKPGCISGKLIPSSERFPHDEAFGDWAFSFIVIEAEATALTRATKKFNELESGN